MYLKHAASRGRWGASLTNENRHNKAGETNRKGKGAGGGGGGERKGARWAAICSFSWTDERRAPRTIQRNQEALLAWTRCVLLYQSLSTTSRCHRPDRGSTREPPGINQGTARDQPGTRTPKWFQPAAQCLSAEVRRAYFFLFTCYCIAFVIVSCGKNISLMKIPNYSEQIWTFKYKASCLTL